MLYQIVIQSEDTCSAQLIHQKHRRIQRGWGTGCCNTPCLMHFKRYERAIKSSKIEGKKRKRKKELHACLIFVCKHVYNVYHHICNGSPFPIKKMDPRLKCSGLLAKIKPHEDKVELSFLHGTINIEFDPRLY